MPDLQRYTFTGKPGACLRLPGFVSKHISPRNIDIWHPADYDASLKKRYPVIYMHDGQNLFDPALSYLGVDWGVDQAIEQLMQDRGIPGAIVVGIWNSPLRYREYMPQRPFAKIAGQPEASQFIHEKGGEPISDAYLRCIVDEVKPFVDGNFRTLADAESTFLMGSSMGGLISLYGVASYPQIFSKAACLSTHWTIGGSTFVDEIAKMLPPPAKHRFYFDFGTLQQDALYEPNQTRIDQQAFAVGYVKDRNWKTVRWEGHEHSERAWRSRLSSPLTYLLCD